MQYGKRYLAALLGLALAGPASAAGVTGGEVLLGTHLDLSGPTSANMALLRNAMQMRIDDANAAGGVHGRRLRLLTEDNGSQPQLAVRAVQKLVRSDGVFAIVNPFGSGTNAATVKMATDAGVLVFAPWGASATLQRITAGSPLLFTTVQNYDTTTATGLAWALRTWKPARVGVIYQDGPMGDLVRAGAHRALRAAGLAAVAEAAYKVGDIDFSSQVARMKAARADLILAGTVVRETVGVMAEVKKLQWNDVKVLTTMPGRSSIVAQLGASAVEGLYGIGGWHLHAADTGDPAAARFMADYRRRYGGEADENAANAYAYMDWLIAGLQAAGRDLTAQGLARALQGVAHEGFTTYARQRFVANHASPEYVSIDQVRAGRWVQVAAPMAGGPP